MVKHFKNAKIRSFSMILFGFIFACALLLLIFVQSADASSGKSSVPGTSFQAHATLSASKAKLNGLVEKETGIHYYLNGKKLKSQWKTVKGKKYYFNKAGVALTGVKKIKGVWYMFRDNGTLNRSKKKRLVERGDYTYCVTKKGQVLTDWQLMGNALYHFTSNGRMQKSKTIDRVKLNSDGKAITSKATKSKKAALKIMAKIAPTDASKSKKLRAAWNFMTSRRNFVYMSIYPNLKEKHWQHSTASYMLTARRGNCYSFACAFAALAEVIGYDPYLVLGRVHGSRDGARDGFTRHAWVKIDGKYYDPEIRFANGIYIYRSSYYTMAHKNARLVKF